MLAAPIDLIRTQQAAFKGSFEATPSMGQVTMKILRSKQGVQGLFSGSTALMGRAITFNVSQLLTYDEAKAQAVHVFQLPAESMLVHGAASMMAGLVATTASAPSENVKTVMQTSPGISIRDACTRIYVQEAGGIGAFFRGWWPLYAKIAPHTLVVFVVLEQMRLLLRVPFVQ